MAYERDAKTVRNANSYGHLWSGKVTKANVRPENRLSWAFTTSCVALINIYFCAHKSQTEMLVESRAFELKSKPSCG